MRKKLTTHESLPQFSARLTDLDGDLDKTRARRTADAERERWKVRKMGSVFPAMAELSLFLKRKFDSLAARPCRDPPPYFSSSFSGAGGELPAKGSDT